jgi:multidrug resistance efflux pump
MQEQEHREKYEKQTKMSAIKIGKRVHITIDTFGSYFVGR